MQHHPSSLNLVEENATYAAASPRVLPQAEGRTVRLSAAGIPILSVLLVWGLHWCLPPRASEVGPRWREAVPQVCRSCNDKDLWFVALQHMKNAGPEKMASRGWSVAETVLHSSYHKLR